MKRVASNAYIQTAAQAVMLEKFGAAIGRELRSTQVPFEGVFVQVDGFYDSGSEVILAECWAHIGKAKVAQRHKVAADVLKLALASAAVRRLHSQKTVKSFIVFADTDAADVLGGSTWLAAAARAFNVGSYTVDLGAEMIERIKAAQKAQDLRHDQAPSAAEGA